MDALPLVLTLTDMAQLLRVSVRTIQRLRALGAFPYPELPPLDARPRWSRDEVLARLRPMPRPSALRKTA